MQFYSKNKKKALKKKGSGIRAINHPNGSEKNLM
jgi:hypothetical protein